ncbi:hypothetical protein NQ317_010655 [Molorchus minor]|uniref:SNF2 N-terminal domain-containing protein n=1 Tax=Molorchus minor TaxID=1323400 RepID=A0ABQ9K8E0_9CUCU|nr:hypothetical protein NQ317_010655 [Molorchus minor]
MNFLTCMLTAKREALIEEPKSEDDSISSDSQRKKDKKKWRSDKLLNTKIDSSDSEEEFSKFCKKKDKSREEIMSDDEIKSPNIIRRKTKKRIKRSVVISDSDDSDGDKNKDKESSDEEKSSSKSSSEDEEEEKVKQKPRRRIRKAKDSSSSSEEDKSTRKHIRRVLGKDSLSETTKQAEAEEKERKARIAEKQKKYNQIYENINESKVEKVVLDYDEQGKKEELAVHKSLVKKLKPHQASGVQFMWDACFESVKRAKTTEGSGCILAHCMGLGKTLQVITLVHTLLMESKRTGMEKVLVVCPLNTVLNWKSEFKKWLPKKK